MSGILATTIGVVEHSMPVMNSDLIVTTALDSSVEVKRAVSLAGTGR